MYAATRRVLARDDFSGLTVEAITAEATLGYFTSAQVENRNEEARSNGTFDTLWEEQRSRSIPKNATR